MIKKQPHPEEGYFSRLDVEKKHKLAMEMRAELAAEELENLRRLHHMHCASCGWEMETIIYQGIPIQKCFNCGGAFMEEEAFSKICGKDSKFIQSLIDLFKF